MIVEKMTNKLMTIFSFLPTTGTNVFQNETEVKEAPATEVMAALHKTIPKKR